MTNKNYLTDPPKIWMIIFWCSFAVLIAFLVYGATERNWLAFVLDLMSSGVFYVLYARMYWNYPILQEDYLVIQNILLCSSKFRYSDIEHATITNAVRGNLLSIKLRHKRFARHITISCVHDNNLDQLAVDLQQKGVNTIRKMSPFD